MPICGLSLFHWSDAEAKTRGSGVYADPADIPMVSPLVPFMPKYEDLCSLYLSVNLPCMPIYGDP